MIKVGIYAPSWLLARHNTDQKVVKMLERLNEYTEIETMQVASKSYTLSFNLNKVIQRIYRSKPLLKHGMKDQSDLDLIYHYGHPSPPKPFFDMVKGYPVFMTSGFMTDRYIADLFGTHIDRQKEADEIAKIAEKADALHFHTCGGRNRFLHYRPDFREKTVAIPFFLPSLTMKDDRLPTKELQPNINLLFVGNQGIQKGLFKLIEALDLLGAPYLNTHRVAVTVVSKDKPKPKSNINLKWFVKLPHEQVLQLMNEASIFVLVPRCESYGLVLVEALNSGCAIITDDDETREEIIGDAGVMLSSHSAVSISNAIKQLIEDVELRRDLGRRAFQRAKSHFHPDVVAQQYRNCFQTLLKKAI